MGFINSFGIGNSSNLWELPTAWDARQQVVSVLLIGGVSEELK